MANAKSGASSPGAYLPEAVLVETDAGAKPALCYIAHEMEPAPADPAYVERIVGPARGYGFPASYVAKLEAFWPARQAAYSQLPISTKALQ